ncbi:MAG: hypothetical protein WC708_03130 [Lentisphaeria bacterium]
MKNTGTCILSSLNAFIRPAFFSFTENICSLLKLLNIARCGINGLTNREKMVNSIVKVLEYYDEFDKADETKKELPKAKLVTDQAIMECENDFPLLHAQALILLWGALERLVLDILFYIIVNNNVYNEPGLVKMEIKVLVCEYENMDKEDRGRYLVRAIENDSRRGSKFKLGVDRFESILEVIGLAGSVSPEIKKVIYELQQFRNSIVHAGCLVDEKFIRLLPESGYKIGQKIMISSAQFMLYYEAVFEYSKIICDRALNKYPASD